MEMDVWKWQSGSGNLEMGVRQYGHGSMEMGFWNWGYEKGNILALVILGRTQPSRRPG